MGTTLWQDEENKKFLNMEETIGKTNFFSLFPFKKNVKQVLLSKNIHPSNLGMTYALINTFSELNKINEQKLF